MDEGEASARVRRQLDTSIATLRTAQNDKKECMERMGRLGTCCAVVPCAVVRIVVSVS